MRKFATQLLPFVCFCGYRFLLDLFLCLFLFRCFRKKGSEKRQVYRRFTLIMFSIVHPKRSSFQVVASTTQIREVLNLLPYLLYTSVYANYFYNIFLKIRL